MWAKHDSQCSDDIEHRNTNIYFLFNSLKEKPIHESDQIVESERKWEEVK